MDSHGDLDAAVCLEGNMTVKGRRGHSEQVEGFLKFSCSSAACIFALNGSQSVLKGIETATMDMLGSDNYAELEY